MFKNLFNKKTKYEKFWEWFLGFEPVMFQSLQENSQNKPMFGILQTHLKQVHPQLDFEFGIKPDKIELVISANGVKDVFNEVEKLVEISPPFDKWKITAFKQRIHGDDYEVTYGNLTIGYKDIYFQYTDSDNELGIQLNIKNFVKNPDYINATYRLLDCLLGEYDVTFNIDFIQWEALKDNEINSLSPFVKLRDLVDSRK